MAGKGKSKAPGKKRAARLKAPEKPTRGKGANARKRPSRPSLRVGRETFEAAFMQHEELPVRNDEPLEKLELPKPPAAAPAIKRGIVPPAAAAIVVAAGLTAATGGAIFLLTKADPIIAAGLLLPLFVGAAIVIYGRLEDGERRQA